MLIKYWYDLFALFYDRSLERHYRTVREVVIAELEVKPGSVVLDVACGTGQNFPLIQRSIQVGLILGVDVSGGMLRKARQRTASGGWTNVRLFHRDIVEFNERDLQSVCGLSDVDCVVCTLGLTVMENWQDALARSLNLLKPGGRIVLFDAYAQEPVFRTHIARLLARADLSRRFWEPLRERVDTFHLVNLPGTPEAFGGQLILASGLKPYKPQVIKSNAERVDITPPHNT